MNDDAAKLEKLRKRREDELLLLLLLIVAHATDAAELSDNPGESITNTIIQRAPLEISGSMADVHMDAAAIYSPAAQQKTREELMKIYEASATTSAQAMADTLTEKFSDATDIASIESAMESAGYTTSNSTGLELGVERSIVPASNAGLVAGAIASGGVTGFEHVSVLDDSTTDICDERDGLMLTVDDPYWATNWPSLHWRCRSVIVPIFGEFEPSKWLPTTPPMPGFGIAPMLFGEAA